MSRITDFYWNDIPTSGGSFIDAILQWGPDEWEASHEEIQWLFPSKQESQFNPDAPILTDEDIKLFTTMPELKTKFTQVFETFLGVFGLKKVTLGFAWRDDLDYDPKWWLRNFNHNYLRFSRILDCLSKFDRKQDAFDLFIFLANDKAFAPDDRETTVKHWKDAALGKK